MSQVIVIGGGAAGMFAAIAAADQGHKVTLLEHNEKLGKKLFITGKGRCNLTNAGDMDDLFNNIMSNKKFLYSAFYGYDNMQVIDFFENAGMPTKTERGDRVFPVSDHSSDVIKALTKEMEKRKVKVLLKTHVSELITELDQEGKQVCTGIRLADGRGMRADAVIVACGGMSYPLTGSTGDGYHMAEATGHRIVKPVPSLVPLETKETWCRDMMGLSLKNVAIQIRKGKKVLYKDFGEMLFTHFGVSGPMILSASAAIKAELFQEEMELYIDLKPAMDMDELDKRVLRLFDENKNKQFKNSLEHLLPAKLIPVVRELSAIDPDKQVNEISKGERQALCMLLKNFPLTITGKRGWNEAIITKGGVSVKDINPSTMESKLVSNLYFCGEVLDLDAMTGGFNLQIAWSTGHLAGSSIS